VNEVLGKLSVGNAITQKKLSKTEVFH